MHNILTTRVRVYDSVNAYKCGFPSSSIIYRLTICGRLIYGSESIINNFFFFLPDTLYAFAAGRITSQSTRDYCIGRYLRAIRLQYTHIRHCFPMRPTPMD